MNATIKEWVDKATGDYHTASRELQVSHEPNFDAVCFHAQQCIEKLMKAGLIQHGVVPPRTHNLIHLDQLLAAADKTWAWPVADLRFLSRAAVAFRYPGEAAGSEFR